MAGRWNNLVATGSATGHPAKITKTEPASPNNVADAFTGRAAPGTLYRLI